MTKKSAIGFFGSVNLTAHALGVTAQAVDKWPPILSASQKGRVITAGLASEGLAATRRAFPKAFPKP